MSVSMSMCVCLIRGAEELQKKMESTKELNADAVATRVQLDLERKIVGDEACTHTTHLHPRHGMPGAYAYDCLSVCLCVCY